MCIERFDTLVRGGKPGKYDYSGREMERLGAITSAHESGRRRRPATLRRGSSASTWRGTWGDEFDGVITGVTNFGVFVQITELMTDGLVHVTSLVNDYYHYDSASQRLVGERSGRAFGLGDAMRVKVQRVDMETRRIDFRPVEKRK